HTAIGELCPLPYGCRHLPGLHLNGQLGGLDSHQLPMQRFVAHQIGRIKRICWIKKVGVLGENPSPAYVGCRGFGRKPKSCK
ncbi:MAG: hypothetical protein LHW56_07025, partial [Candidatus Cloacimonetes bacterium]|nr:hypothetical protein [Candidatus Cloacimonadota bacterium]MDY0172644.1 hypothetical protein [Candidatus Cloacimonadaceae bacterium]